MKKITKILVPIDYSEASNDVLKFALRLADRVNATLEVLHVVTHDVPALDYASFVAIATDEKVKIARSLMNKTIARAQKNVNELLDNMPDIQTDIEVGVPDTKIIEVAIRDDVDYIVMGTQGQNTVWDRFLGSTAVDVLKFAPCPVFVIPEKAEYKEEMELGYATDFSDADAFEIWKASKLLQPFKSNISAVHLAEREEYTEGKIAELDEFFTQNAPQIDIRFYSFYSEDMVEGMNDFIRKHNISLMVMYKPKRNFFEKIFHKSFTKELVRKIEVPLLILNEK